MIKTINLYEHRAQKKCKKRKKKNLKNTYLKLISNSTLENHGKCKHKEMKLATTKPKEERIIWCQNQTITQQKRFQKMH